ncbi:hypothetical protein KR018_012522 [Drosophila ironensis]|nr:hypothetical protein KR018_012522 [Drosophila ironensis]
MPTYPKGLFNNSYLSMAPGTDSDMSSSIKDNKAKLKLPKSGRNVKLETFDNAHQEQKEKEKEKDQSMTSKSSTIDYEPHLKILKLGLNVDLDTIINACRDLREKQKDQPITSETDNEFVFWLNQREISLNENSSKEMSSNSEVDLESMDLKSLFECESSSSDLPNNLEMKMKPEQEQVKHGPSSSSDLSNNLEMKMKPEQEQVKHGPSAGAAGPEMQAQAPAGRIKLKMD